MRASVPLIPKFASEVTATVCELRNRDTRDLPSHPELDGAVVAGRQVAIARQRPQWEELRIAVVAQIEHARESGRGVTRTAPTRYRRCSSCPSGRASCPLGAGCA